MEELTVHQIKTSNKVVSYRLHGDRRSI